MSRRSWGMDDDIARQIFCAALSGICANPNFFGPLMQQSPQAAFEFADQVVQFAMYGPPEKADADEAPAETDHRGDRCPNCGYTLADCQIHGDHHLCKGVGPKGWERRA